MGDRARTTSSSDDRASEEAARIFEEWVHDLGKTPGQESLEECCRKHPSLAESLRSLYRDYRAARELFERPSLGDRLAERFGADVDPGISLSGASESATGASTGHESSAWRSDEGARYRDQGEIGRGGMGAIHRVWDASLRRELAMKVMLERRRGQRRAASRFLEEAQVTSQLSHPGIVPVHEVGLDAEGRLFFTMKLVTGLSLDEVLARVLEGDDEWSLTRAVGVLLRACEAVAYAHEKGVVHRDLKPSNIMVGDFGEVYVMDWGLAKILDEAGTPAEGKATSISSDRSELVGSGRPSPLVTHEGDVLGTPAYMAPEQAAGSLDAVGPALDVYAMGAILHHLLAGAPPRGHRAAGSLDASPQPELVAICRRAMATRPEERYAGIQDLRSDLQSWLEGRVVTAYESGAVAALRKWVRRNRVLAVSLGAALAAVPVIASLFTYALTQRSEAAQNLRLFELLRYRVDLNEARAAADELYPAWPEKLEQLNEWVVVHGLPLTAAHETIRRARLEFAGPESVFRFDGAQDHVIVAHSDDLNPQPGGFTAEFWMKGERAPGLCVALDKSHGFFDNTGWAFQSGPDGKEIGFLMGGGGALPYVNIVGLAPGSSNLDGAWHHLAGTWDGATVRLYQDGRLLAERPLTSAENNTRDLYLGAAWCGGETGRFFRGELDEVAIHSRALDEGELLAIASAGPPVTHGASTQRRADTARPTVALWQGDGDARDSVGDHDGVVLGSVFASQDAHGVKEQRRFLSDTLRQLAGDLEWFARHPRGAMRDVERRIEWAERVQELTIDRHQERWRQARSALATADGVVASELYALSPIDLAPQMGLVPIGMNPATGLWEFYHLRSAAFPGDIPVHGAGGEIAVEAGTGIVFVLVPGGTFRMGASKDPDDPGHEPQAWPNESPIHAVTLEPFFMARHELTKAQWSRLTNENLGDDTFPVHDVSWEMSVEALGRHGLQLPTEAQWEYAARAGTRTPWWSGVHREDLVSVANFGDGAAWSASRRWAGIDPDVDDGFVTQAAAASTRANPWGLHEVHGNVREWCADPVLSYTLPPRPGDGLRAEGDSTWMSARGGSYRSPWARTRSASREAYPAWDRAEDIGLRVSRALHRPD